MASIDESYTDDDYDNGSISKKNLKDIRDGNKIYPELDARDARFKICDCIRKNQNEWKGSELSANITGKCLHKIFKAFINELNNALYTLG